MLLRHFCLFILTFSFAYGEKPSKTEIVDGYKYELYEQGKSRTNAISICKKRNAWLVEIKDKEINEVVKSMTGHDVLIGANNDNGWKWNDGSLMRYTNWANNQPVKNSANNCLLMNQMQGTWKNTNCGNNDQRFVCQSDVNNYTSCVDGVCTKRGVCVMTDRRYKCSCDDGYFGTKCEKRIIEISSDEDKYIIKRRQDLAVTFTVVSYDGNVDVKRGNSVLASTTSINSSQVTEVKTITFGPLDSEDDSLTYAIIAVSKKNIAISTTINIEVEVQDYCESTPCENGASCRYSTSHPYYICICSPAFTGSTCSSN